MIAFAETMLTTVGSGSAGVIHQCRLDGPPSRKKAPTQARRNVHPTTARIPVPTTGEIPGDTPYWWTTLSRPRVFRASMTAMIRSSARTNLSDRGASRTIGGTGRRSTSGGTEPVTYREGGMAEASRQHTAYQSGGDAPVADQIAHYPARAREDDEGVRPPGRYARKGERGAGR